MSVEQTGPGIYIHFTGRVKTSGVYKITNKASGKDYIGSSVDIYHRMAQHKSCLKAGNHHSDYLQKSFNKHGEGVFSVSIIEFAAPELLQEREQHWLDTVKPAYNTSSLAYAAFLGMKHTQEAKDKISAALKLRFRTAETRQKMSEAGRRKVNVNKGPAHIINKWDLDCNHIATYVSMVAATKESNMSIGAIKSCVNGVTASTGGFIYTRGENKPVKTDGLKKKAIKGTPVYELDTNGVIIAEHKNITAAALSCGVAQPQLSNWVNGVYSGKRRGKHQALLGRFVKKETT